jgi:hypothetical protein
MDRDTLQRLARRGAELRLAELAEEVAMLEGLMREGETPKASTLPREAQTSNDAPKRRRRMSAAAKLVISKRMKAYWAARRREEQ